MHVRRTVNQMLGSFIGLPAMCRAFTNAKIVPATIEMSGIEKSNFSRRVSGKIGNGVAADGRSVNTRFQLSRRSQTTARTR